jgi:hypothetical protein
VHLCSIELSEMNRGIFMVVSSLNGAVHTVRVYGVNMALKIGGRGRGCERGESFNGGCQRSRELLVVYS